MSDSNPFIQEWKCPRCTFSNSSNDPKCKMCEVEKPAYSPREETQQAHGEQEVHHSTTNRSILHTTGKENDDDEFIRENKVLLAATKKTGEDGATVNARLQEQERLEKEAKKMQKDKENEASAKRHEEEHQKLLAIVHGQNQEEGKIAVPVDGQVVKDDQKNNNNGVVPLTTTAGAAAATGGLVVNSNDAMYSPMAGGTTTTVNTNPLPPSTTNNTPYQGTTLGGPGTNPTPTTSQHPGTLPPGGSQGNTYGGNGNGGGGGNNALAGLGLMGALGGLAVAGGASSNNNNNNNNSSSSAGLPGPGEWQCQTCTLINKMSSQKCDACGADSPFKTGPWIAFEMSQMEYDHLVACYYRFLGNAPDDKMGRREIQTLCRFLNFAHSDEQIDNLFAEMDRDKSGKLSCDEFCRWCSSHRPDSNALYGLTQPEYHAVLFSFEKYDRNHDGFLTPSECIALIMDKELTKNLDEAQYLTTKVDSDRDGKITLHELLVANADWKRSGKMQDRA